MSIIGKLNNLYMERHPREAARVLSDLPAKEATELLRSAPPAAAAATLRQLPAFWNAGMLAELPIKSAIPILLELPLVTQVSTVRQMKLPIREALLKALAQENREPLLRLLPYPGGSAGALIDPHVFTVVEEATVQEVRSQTRLGHPSLRYYLYMVDRNHRLTGVLTLRQLMQAGPKQEIAELATRAVHSVNAAARERDIVGNPHWRLFHMMPVVDDDNTLLGVIRYETLRETEQALHAREVEDTALATLLSLGELYWTGLAGVFRGIGTDDTSPRQSTRESR